MSYKLYVSNSSHTFQRHNSEILKSIKCYKRSEVLN